MPLSPKVRENSSIIYQQIDFDTSDEGVEVLMMGDQGAELMRLALSSLLMHCQFRGLDDFLSLPCSEDPPSSPNIA